MTIDYYFEINETRHYYFDTIQCNETAKSQKKINNNKKKLAEHSLKTDAFLGFKKQIFSS